MNGDDCEDELRAQVVRQREVIEQLEDQRQRLAALLLEMPKLFAAREPDALVIGCAEAAQSLAGAAFALFVPADAEQAQTLVGLEWADFAEAPAPGLAPLLGVHSVGAARIIDDVTRWAPSDAASLLYGVLSDGRLVRSWLIAPVRGRDDELRGVLYLGHPRPHAFSSLHEQELGLLGSSLGIALDAALLAAERDRVLAGLESSLLPPLLPSIPELDIAARYRPADDAAQVGGDFYDVFKSGERRWSLVVGDVCGAGPEAAAVTGIARYSIRALAAELPPAAALERLNATLIERGPDARFLTAVLADVTITDSRRVSVTMANAGHPPPLVLRDDGTSYLLERGHGALLGILPRVDADDVPVVLEPGDALILYTDGVVEARDKERELFGFERLLELAGTCAGRTATGIARRIEVAAVGHSSGTVDDIAVLVVRRRPESTARPR
jgi:serine phosphatase RsbU (regulator of sigma subunit)